MTRSRTSSWLHACLAAGIIGALTVALFLPTSRGEFVWDDDGLLGANYRAVDTWSDAITGFGQVVTGGIGVAYYRPILIATFVADYQARGADPVRFHRTNVLLHGVNAMLVLVLLFLLTRNLWASAVASVVFAVHPIQAQAVSLVMGRNDELLLPPIVAMLVADELAERQGRRGLGAIVIALCYAIALWTKETAVVAPVLILLTDLLWRGRSFRDLRQRLPLLALLTVITALYFAVRIVVVGAIVDAGQYGTLGPFGRLALATATLGYYLRLLVLPWGFAPAPYHPGLVDPASLSFWIAALFVVGLSVVVIAALRWAPRVAYGLLFFVVGSLPVLGLGTLMKLTMLEHRTYLPMLGVALVVATLTPRASASFAGRLGVVVGLIGLAALTAQRLPSYATSLSLWAMGVANVPTSDYARNNYAAALMDANRVPEAMGHLQEALRLNPEYDRARYNLAACLEAVDRRAEAIAELETLGQRRPKDWAVQNRLGLMRSRVGDTAKAREAFERAIALQPDEPVLLRNFHDVLTRLGDHAEAVKQAERLAELQPQAPESWLRLGSTLRYAGRPADAVAAYERALALGYDSGPLRLEVAAALWDAGRPADAVPHAERARALGARDAPIIERLREAGFLDFPLSSRPRALTMAQA